MFTVESKMDHVQKESLVVSATPLHRGTVANLKVKKEMQAALTDQLHRETDAVMEGQKSNHPTLHQNRRRRMTCRLETVEQNVL